MTYLTNPFTNPPAQPNAATHRAQRLATLSGSINVKDIDFEASPYMAPQAIADTHHNTQFGAETHRLLTPVLQTLLRVAHTELMDGLDSACKTQTDKARDAARSRPEDEYDVAIIGSGPHGAAVAMTLREQFPTLRTILIEKGNRLGGHWRSYGSKASFFMNSRVRRADHTLPPIPRTPASINPLGRYATLELSDVVVGNYATNVEMGDVCALNGFLAVNAVILGTEVRQVSQPSRSNNPSAATEIFLNSGARIRAKVVVAAVGVRQESALSRNYNYPVEFNTASMYEHFGTSTEPLRDFHQKRIAVLGGGDSALTCLEAMLGNLPADTYGPYGVGRYRPTRINWVGAPAETAAEIQKCLRSRYANGIIQALPKFKGDKGALIRPILGKVADASTKSVTLRRGFSPNKIAVDIVVDCTNRTPTYFQDIPYNQNGTVIRVGPGARPALPEATTKVIDNLGVKANTVSLWAQMPQTDEIAMKVGYQALQLSR